MVHDDEEDFAFTALLFVVSPGHQREMKLQAWQFRGLSIREREGDDGENDLIVLKLAKITPANIPPATLSPLRVPLLEKLLR